MLPSVIGSPACDRGRRKRSMTVAVSSAGPLRNRIDEHPTNRKLLSILSAIAEAR
jgi:hypothetical protein